MEEKEKIREWVKEKLKELPEEERRKKSEKIKAHLLTHPWFEGAKHIFIYLSFQKEVDTFPIIRESLKAGKTILVPWTVNQQEMIPVVLKKLENLEKGKWGIPQPVEKFPFPREKIDLVILPGLAFDKKGNRLGRGKAFYDRFLSSLSSRIKKVALAYSFQVIDNLPTDHHDIPVEEIITENGGVIQKTHTTESSAF